MTNSLSLFSDETLESIAMAEVIGGAAENVVNNCYGGNCVTGCGGTDNGLCGNETNVAGAGCIKKGGGSR